MSNSTSTMLWHRITLHTPELTHGKRLSRFLKETLGDALEGRTVLIYEVEGGGDPSKGITQVGCVGITVSELAERLEHTEQLDWATFCFMRGIDEKEARALCGNTSISEVISRSDFAIRVIDDSYLDVFTPDRRLCDTFIQHYPGSETESSPLNAMVFPR